MSDQPEDEPVDDEPVEDEPDAVLDPDADKLVLEVAEWSPEDRADLVDALTEEGVRHVVDEMGDVWFEAIDEDRVDLIVDELVDEDGDDDEDHPEASTVLSDLFVAADKLRKHPRDATAILNAVDSSTSIIAMPPPYGFERATWAKIGLRAGGLRSLLETQADDEEVVEAAEELRELLHPMV